MTILVIAEYSDIGVSQNTRATVTAALQIDREIHLLIVGSGDIQKHTDESANIANVAKVIKIESPIYAEFLAENVASLIAGMASEYSHILAPASTFGKDFMPRVAAILDVAQISDIISVESEDIFKRTIYAGNAIATIKSSDAIKIITVRPSAFDKAADGGSAIIIDGSVGEDSSLSEFVSKEDSQSDRPELTSAKIVVSGGRGVGSVENFKLIEGLADKLGGAVGASRVAVDSGYVPNDYQVGQTGKIIAPDLYIAIGISGAIQHLAGMKDSKIIVAINNDENAPIFEIADYGLVMDLFEAIPQLEVALG